MDKDYWNARQLVDNKLLGLVASLYSPAHAIDILKECIKLLQPYAKKQEEVTHA